MFLRRQSSQILAEKGLHLSEHSPPFVACRVRDGFVRAVVIGQTVEELAFQSCSYSPPPPSHPQSFCINSIILNQIEMLLVDEISFLILLILIPPSPNHTYPRFFVNRHCIGIQHEPDWKGSKLILFIDNGLLLVPIWFRQDTNAVPYVLQNIWVMHINPPPSPPPPVSIHNPDIL